MFELLTGNPPFVDENPYAMYDKILQEEVKFPENFDEGPKDLIQKLLEKDYTRRIKLNDIKKHHFFRDINWRHVEKQQLRAVYIPCITSKIDSSNFDRYEEDNQVEELADIAPDLFSEF